MTRRVKKWRQGKAQLAALKKSQETHVAIEAVMRVRMDGTKRPICIGCGHSVMSHGERDGKLFCWGCLAVNQKQCGERNDNTRTTGN